MEHIAQLRDVEGMLKDQKAHKLLDKLANSREPLFQLGRIVAVDLFTGNRDRFDATGRIVNKGNVIFTKNDDKTYTPVGLDFYEAQGEASNLYDPAPADWDGMVLADPERLKLFGKKAVESMNELIANALTTIDRGKLLGADRIQDFLDGMNDGIAMLRQFLLETSQNGRALPSGVSQRLTRLGWMGDWQAPAPPRPSSPPPAVPPRPTTPPPGAQQTTWKRAHPAGVWKSARPRK